LGVADDQKARARVTPSGTRLRGSRAPFSSRSHEAMTIAQSLAAREEVASLDAALSMETPCTDNRVRLSARGAGGFV